jgi:hypothetical protein
MNMRLLTKAGVLILATALLLFAAYKHNGDFLIIGDLEVQGNTKTIKVVSSLVTPCGTSEFVNLNTNNKIYRCVSNAWVEQGGGGTSSPLLTATNNAPYPVFGWLQAGASVNPSGGSANRVNFYTFNMPFPAEFTRLSVSIPSGGQGAAGCKINIAIFDYTKTRSFNPNNLIDCTTSGSKSVTWTTTQSIAAGGGYAIGIGSNDTTVTISYGTTSSSLVGIMNNGSNNRYGFCANTLDPTTTVMPAACGTLSESSFTSFPMVVMEP